MRAIPAAISTTHNTSKYAFVPGWRFPGEVDRWFSDNLSRLDDPVPRPIVAIPCGGSRLGDLRVDRFHGEATIKADFFRLPFRDQSVGTIIADPPWDLEFHQRMDYMAELSRVHRFGGILLWTAPWLPLHGAWEYDSIVVGHSRVGLPRNARIMVRALRRHTTKGAKRHQLKAKEKKRRTRGPTIAETYSEAGYGRRGRR